MDLDFIKLVGSNIPLILFIVAMITEYNWWGYGDPQPPETLKTKKQLSAIGKTPGEPVGVIKTPKYDCYLYDPETCPDKKPLTEKQLSAIAMKKEESKQRRLLIKIEETEVSLNYVLYRILDDLDDLDPCNEHRTHLIELGYDVQPFTPEFVERRLAYLVNWFTRAKQLMDDLKRLRPPQPKPYDVVLGGKSTQPRSYDAVLGGKT